MKLWSSLKSSHKQQISEGHGLAEATLETPQALFPMYTVQVQELLQMVQMKPHELLLADGKLHEFTGANGKAAFVSHQWVSKHHPDPDMKQFKVLKGALANLLSGACKIEADVAYEVMLGLSRVKEAGKVLRSLEAQGGLYIWYDYFSCPQLTFGVNSTVVGNLRKAIDSIPSYITRSDMFMALNPAIEGEDGRLVINELSWAARGWCLLEKNIWDLTGRGAMCIVIKSPMHCEMNFWTGKPPGTGDFSVEDDKHRIVPGFQQLIKNRLLLHLAKGDLTNFRLLLNQRKHYLRDLPMQDQESEMPDSIKNPSPVGIDADFQGEIVAQFLRENRFQHLKSRDSSGWSPLCYAALRGDPKILEAFLAKGGDPNDRTTKARLLDNSSKHFSLLSICTRYEHFDAMKLLIQHRAEVDVKGTDQPPLHMACGLDSRECLDLLCAAGADTRLRTSFGVSCVALAACAPAPNALEGLLRRQGDQPDLSGSPLFLSAMLRGSAETTKLLVQAKADLNEQWDPPMTDPFGLLCKIKSFQHRMKHSRTRLTTLAHHHKRATPLMASIICGNFEMAAALINEGARVDLKNVRGKSARDLAREMFAPDYVLEALEGDVSKCVSFLSALSSNSIEETRDEDSDSDSFSI